jgi:AcrR family transcriptional regulator
MILDMENAILDEDVVQRVARASQGRRAPGYADEVRALLAAAVEVMRRCGTTSRPRVADIVAVAGLSNDVFYRHFASKDALVEALLEGGTRRLAGYLEHRMAGESDPGVQVRRWVEGVLSQAEPEVAATTLAVLSNGSGLGGGAAAGRHFASTPLAGLLRAPFAALGSPRPDLDASLAAHAVLGRLSDHLWRGSTPTRDELDRMTAFCLAAVRA